MKLEDKANNLYRPNNTSTPELSLEAQFRRLYDATPHPPGRHPVPPIGGTRLLGPYVHTSTGRMLLSCPMRMCNLYAAAYLQVRSRSTAPRISMPYSYSLVEWF